VVTEHDGEQWARDRAEIESLMVLFARGHDVDSRYYEMCMAEDVEIDYGENMKFRGVAQLKRMRDEGWSYDPARPERGGFTYTQHVISNALVEIDGDTGRAQYYAYASHGLIDKNGKPALVPAGAIYTHDVERTSDGWRVTRHRCRLLWMHDPDGLMPASAAMLEDPSRAEGLLW
jgi:hypothetical protein